MIANTNKPAWAGTNMRLDPYVLPQKVSYVSMSSNMGRSSNNNSVKNAEINVTLDTKGAVMRRELGCGLPLSMALPSRAFKGVAARAYENEDGTNTVTLELLHEDADLSVPLLVSENMDDIAADWQCWSRALHLPMLIVEAHGAVTPVKSSMGFVKTETPAPRRRRHFAVKHRPNFLRRRKAGQISEVVKLTPDEIIART